MGYWIFVPNSIAVPPGAPIHWFDGSNIDNNYNSTLTDNTTFTTWRNLGSSSLNVSQATPLVRPIYRATGGPNNKPNVDFQQDFFTSVATTVNAPWIIAIVAKVGSVSGTSFSCFLDFGGGHTGAINNGITNKYYLTRGGTGFVPSGTATYGVWNSHIITCDAALTPDFIYRLSGVDTGQPLTAANISALQIGRVGSTSLFNSRIAEILIYNDGTTVSQIENYFTKKYGVFPQ